MKELYGALKRGPAFLLLGQDYLRLETRSDPFLNEVLRKLSRSPGAGSSYDLLLDGIPLDNVETILSWMDERCRRLAVPQWLKAVSEFSWNGIYTSAIDSIWPAAFRTPWRELHPIFEEKYKPSDSRNRTVLHCTYLFGCVNRTDEAERPPLARFELTKRRQVAVALARRLPELVTPLGVLVIEGYAAARDWLRPEDLAPVIDELNPGQTHIFGATSELLEDPYVRELVGRGKLVPHREDLAAVLTSGSEQGYVRLGAPPPAVSGRTLTVEDSVLTIPQDLWNQVSRSAMVLDDTVLLPPPPLSEDARYHEFRSFLAFADGRPQWSVFARGFVFSRLFIEALTQVVQQRLSAKSLQDEPVILHGQTGTGKTVAMGALAYSIRRALKYPVLFIEKSTKRPSPSDVDRFCQWAEDSGAAASLVVWDGMIPEEEYGEFLRYLTGRGRKVTLVGSCYRIPDQHARPSRFVLASAELSPTEAEKFAEFLRSFHPALDQVIPQGLDDTFLVALYRLLPPTRSQIRAGVSQEVDHAERAIVDKAAQLPPDFVPPTALGLALYKAGLITMEQLSATGTKVIGDEVVSDIEEMTGLVMVPGRFGLRVPLELLLRAMGRNGFANFSRLFEGIDIFRWFEDSVGNVEIGPRHPLEARLLVQSRMGGAKTETSFGRRLLLEVREDAPEPAESREVRFAVDFVRSVGPQGLEAGYFAPYFKSLSESLRELRTERGLESPRLMLQEANLLREWAVDRTQKGGQQAEIQSALDDAEAVLRKALDIVSRQKRQAPLRGVLLVELAALLGTKARTAIDYGLPPSETAKMFAKARGVIFEARVQDPVNYYPVDVLAWVTRDALTSGILDEASRAEAKADVIYALQTTDAQELDSIQRERLFARRLELADLLSLEGMADQAFDALLRLGSAAGYYLRAIRTAGLDRVGVALADVDSNRLANAARYLTENRQHISNDARCLDLLLDLWWFLKTRMRLLDRERAAIPLDEDLWRQCLDLVLAVEATGKSVRPTTLAFLRGLVLFHLSDFGQSLEVFRQVERDSDRVRGRKRIVRSYLASTVQGRPQKFHGTVSWVVDDGTKGGVYVEELRRIIRFLPRDFGRPEIAKGDTLGEFHIAFNFLGPVADPPGFHRP